MEIHFTHLRVPVPRYCHGKSFNFSTGKSFCLARYFLTHYIPDVAILIVWRLLFIWCEHSEVVKFHSVSVTLQIRLQSSICKSISRCWVLLPWRPLEVSFCYGRASTVIYGNVQRGVMARIPHFDWHAHLLFHHGLHLPSVCQDWQEVTCFVSFRPCT